MESVVVKAGHLRRFVIPSFIKLPSNFMLLLSNIELLSDVVEHGYRLQWFLLKAFFASNVLFIRLNF